MMLLHFFPLTVSWASVTVGGSVYRSVDLFVDGSSVTVSTAVAHTVRFRVCKGFWSGFGVCRPLLATVALAVTVGRSVDRPIDLSVDGSSVTVSTAVAHTVRFGLRLGAGQRDEGSQEGKDDRDLHFCLC